MSDHAEPSGQAANHIVLRLARDVGTRSTESWQVLSLTDRGAFCEFDQRVRTEKYKKVSQRKPKLSLTIRKPSSAVKQRNKGRRRGKNLTDSAAVLNNITVPEYAGSNDVIQSRIVRQKDCKNTNAVAADCCNFCDVLSARRRGTVARKSRTVRVLHKDDHGLKENFYNAADDITDTDNVAGKDNCSSVHFDKVNCITAETTVSKTMLTEEDSHQHAHSCQEISVYNGMLGHADDSAKVGKCRKVMPESSKDPSKHYSGVKRLSETKDEDNETEADKTVTVTSVSESDNLNSDAVCDRMLMSRRARPVKNRRLMNNCYIFTQSVKRTRRRKNSGKKPAPESIVIPECTVTKSSEAGSSQENVSGIVDVANHTDSDKFVTCHIPDSKETSSTADKSVGEYTKHDSTSNFNALDLLNDSKEDTSWNDICGSVSMLKPNTDILETISDISHIPCEESDVKVANVEKTSSTQADCCKYDTVNCDTVATNYISTAENNGLPVHSHVKDESVNDCQFLSQAENVCCDFSHLTESDDIKVAKGSAERHRTESVPGTADNVDFCAVADSSDATEIWHTDSVVHSTSSKYCVPDLSENAITAQNCHVMGVDVSNAEADEPRLVTESDCLLLENAGDVEICADAYENSTDLAAVGLVSIDCEATQFVEAVTDTATAASNDLDNTADIQSLYESAGTDIAEIVDMLIAGNVTDEISTSLAPLKPDIATVSDGELSKNASEINNISHALTASGLNITTDDTNTNSLAVSQGIQLPVVSSVFTPESSLPAKLTAEHHHRRNTHRSHKARRKSVGDKTVEELNHNSAESSADVLNDRLCCEEKCEQLTVDELTDNLRGGMRKFSEGDSVEVMQGADVKTRSNTAARKKRHNASNTRLFYHLPILL